ncbi:hypothetical protein C8A01DRAFT_16996 [Parachaetomium inaequale]|uniref:Uncharacterized protein n=1 Tax=Parachaetomium inaequale TaxID=2588326 RepID=A0AAN6PGU3_9PEZI|nr:hypothetical protein C8A01DRAFT_16996 [Parachaetomium inaequale]
MPPGSSLQYENAFSLLFGRDLCSDAFGSDASDQGCTPSLTLCCVRQNQQYPRCQQSLGKGWCCIGNNPTDNCYVDQPSVCEEQNSVPCTDLQQGTTKACCPRLTSCASDFSASKELVRCNIQYSDLQRAAGSSSSSSSAARATTSSTSSSIAASSTTSSTELSTPATSSGALASSTAATSIAAGDAPQTPLPSGTNSQGQGTAELSGGLIAGAAVGGTLGFVGLLVLGYLMLRRLLKMRQQSGHPPSPGASQPAYGYQDYSQPTTAVVGPAGYGYPGQSTEPVEVMAKHVHGHQPNEPVELPAARAERIELG